MPNAKVLYRKAGHRRRSDRAAADRYQSGVLVDYKGTHRLLRTLHCAWSCVKNDVDLRCCEEHSGAALQSRQCRPG